jgi:hypothetical protein
MTIRPHIFTFFCALIGQGYAGVSIDEATFGESLGGWKKRASHTEVYTLSGAKYRTYKPEITPTPDKGIFISIRIDHVRGWLSSDDHAILEITVDKEGRLISAQSSIAIQGRSISSDLIRGSTAAGQQVVGVDRAVQIGTDLVADLSSKMLREKIVEPGRVSFPSVLRHNYNLLYQSIRKEEIPKPLKVVETKPKEKDQENAVQDKPVAPKDVKEAGKRTTDGLEIKPREKTLQVELPVGQP